MREIPDADEGWNPDEGDELVGHIQDFGYDKSTNEKAFNIQPEDSNKLIRVWRYKPEKLAEEWEEVEPEEGMHVRIKHLGEKEMMKKVPAEGAPRYSDYEVVVLGT